MLFSLVHYVPEKRLCIIIDWWWKRDAAHKRARSLDRRPWQRSGFMLWRHLMGMSFFGSVCEGCEGCLKGYNAVCILFCVDLSILYPEYYSLCYNKLNIYIKKKQTSFQWCYSRCTYISMHNMKFCVCTAHFFSIIFLYFCSL